MPTTAPTVPTAPFLLQSILALVFLLIQTVAKSSPLPINVIADLAVADPLASPASRPHPSDLASADALSTLSPLAAQLLVTMISGEPSYIPLLSFLC
jgi:hypothetical protein